MLDTHFRKFSKLRKIKTGNGKKDKAQLSLARLLV
jgi:hypothetical protein